MPARRLSLLLAALAGVSPGREAPGQPQRAATAQVVGIVYDSLSHATLAGALVQLVAFEPAAHALRLTTETDSTGRFVFSSVARGRFVVGFFHPKLDSLGVEAPITPLEVRGDSVHPLALAVPSLGTVLRHACGDDAQRDSSGAVVGYVRDADHAGVVRGASVRARWSEIVIGGGGVRARVREVRVRSGEDGRYALCQVPAGGLLLVGASATDDSGATLEVRVSDEGLLVRDLFVSTSTPGNAPERGTERARAAAARGVVRGTVRTPYGEPLAGARVRLFGDTHEVRSNARGEFILDALPLGTHMLELRALGFAPRRELVDLLARAHVVVDLPLEEFPTTIDTLRVFGRRRAPSDDLAGFLRRRALAQGVFLDPEAVERRRPLAFTDLMHGIAGVRVVSVGGARAVAMHRLDGAGDCEPELVVDGLRLPRYEANIDDLIPASVIRAIEVYPRRIQAPPEYQSLTCGSIVVWTGARGWLAKRGPGASRRR